MSLKELSYSCLTFTGSKLGIDGHVKLNMVSAIFPIRSNLDYVTLLILQHTQIAKLLWKILCHECFDQGKLKNWFLKTWLPHIKRWCLTYRPDDLILCNTNNGIGRLNEDLKYDELKGLKQSLFSEVLVFLVNFFIPKHYKKYVEFNVRYGDGCKRYASGIRYFLKNRPKKIVEILLEKMCRVLPKAEINRLDQHTFKVNHKEECSSIRKEY